MLRIIKKVSEDKCFIAYEYKASDFITYELWFSKEYYCCEIKRKLDSVAVSENFIRIDKDLSKFIDNKLKEISDNYWHLLIKMVTLIQGRNTLNLLNYQKN